MTRIFIMFILFFTVMTPVTHAQLVQISDLTPAAFYSQMNQALRASFTDSNNTNSFEPLSKGITMSADADYIAYMTGLKNGRYGAVVTLYANRAGYVSKVTVASLDDDKNAFQANLLSCYVIMRAVGLTEAETQQLISNSNQATSSIWCSRSNRRIIFSMNKQQPNIAYMRFLASDE